MLQSFYIQELEQFDSSTKRLVSAINGFCQEQLEIPFETMRQVLEASKKDGAKFVAHLEETKPPLQEVTKSYLSSRNGWTPSFFNSFVGASINTNAAKNLTSLAADRISLIEDPVRRNKIWLIFYRNVLLPNKSLLFSSRVDSELKRLIQRLDLVASANLMLQEGKQLSISRDYDQHIIAVNGLDLAPLLSRGHVAVIHQNQICSVKEDKIGNYGFYEPLRPALL